MVDKRVELFIIGTSKAGTTSICRLLDGHPGITLSDPKETSYFNRHYRPWTLDHYHATFRGPPDTIWLDGSTTYSRETTPAGVGTAARIAAYNPDARIVYVVRHPLRRIESLWVQHRSERYTRVPADFNVALRQLPEHFVDGSNYELQLKFYAEVFAREQILVLFFDDFRVDPQGTLDRILAHVGLESQPLLGERVAFNTRSSKREDHPFVSFARRPGVRRFVRENPTLYAAARWFRERTARSIPDPAWDPDVHAWTLAQLDAPTRRFLAAEAPEHIDWDLSLATCPSIRQP